MKRTIETTALVENNEIMVLGGLIDEDLQENVNKVPVLGVCVGMQIMCLSSQEGRSPGLGWFDSQVLSFNQNDIADNPLPHMGWNSISNYSGPLFANLDSNPYFYFLHSYVCVPNSLSNISSTSTYGSSFCSSLSRDNIYAVQFHPEKSHDNGMTLLGNFAVM